MTPPCANCEKPEIDHVQLYPAGNKWCKGMFGKTYTQKGGESVDFNDEIRAAYSTPADYRILQGAYNELKSEHEKMVEKIRGLENKWRNYLGNFAEQLRTEFPEIFPPKEPGVCGAYCDYDASERKWFVRAVDGADVGYKAALSIRDGKITVEQ